MNFIKTIYFNLIIILSTIQYLRHKTIFVIVNVNVEIINKICINKLLNYVYFKYNYNRAKKIKNVELYFLKCFYYYNKALFFFYLLYLKINIFVIILRNIAFFVMCNNIRTRIFKIIKNVLKTKIIVKNHVNKKVIISQIFLNSKNNEINKNQKKLMFVSFT